MSLLRKLAGETAIYGVSSILGRVLHYFAITPYITRVFQTDEYALVQELYFYIAFLLVLSTHRMETTLFRFGSRMEQESGSYRAPFLVASLSVFSVTALGSLVLFVFAPSIAETLEFPGLEHLVRLVIGITAFDALAAIPFARLRLDNRPIRFAALRLGGIILNLLLIFFFFEFCPLLAERGSAFVRGWYDPEQLVTYYLLANLITSGIVLLALSPLYLPGEKERWVIRWSEWRELYWQMWQYAYPLIIAGLAGIVNSLIGVPLLRLWGSGTPSENSDLAGVFAAATKLAVLINLFIQAYNYAAEPFFFKQSVKSADRSIYADATRALALVGAIGFLGILLYIELIQYLLGKDFREGLDALPLLLMANILLGLFYNFSVSYKLTDRTLLGGIIAVIGMLLTLGLNWLLIPMEHVTYFGPAIAMLVCYAFMALASYWLGRRLYPVPYRLDKIGWYLLLAVAGFGLSTWLDGLFEFSLWPKMLLNTLIILGVFALLYLSERTWFRQILSRRPPEE